MPDSVRVLDEQEVAIAKGLIRQPRLSDNRLAEQYSIPVRTVSRRRNGLEESGLLRYFAEVDMSASGTGRFPCRHQYTVRFRVGVSVGQLEQEIREEPNVVTVFTESIHESWLAEVDGRAALVLVLDGHSDADVARRFQEQIVPSLQKNHGKDSIEDVSTTRLLSRVRLLRNYLPTLNIQGGSMDEDWSVESIFVA